MRSFDHYYVDHVMARLCRIGAEAKPCWGSMDRAGMVRHLTNWVRYSMGQGERLADQSTWIMCNIAYPLIIHGIVRIPRNIKTTAPAPSCLDDVFDPSPDQYLLRMLQTYLDSVQADDIVPHPHPVFGDIGIDGWAKVHMVHFEHHLRQFDA